MTEAVEKTIDEALKEIDAGLGRTMSREIMSAAEVTDLLLDVRMILMAASSEVLVADSVEENLDEPVSASLS